MKLQAELDAEKAKSSTLAEKDNDKNQAIVALQEQVLQLKQQNSEMAKAFELIAGQ